jgi:predicted nucleic acid-binding protein
MSKIVLDTDVLIDLLRGRQATQAFLVEATRHAIPCCSVISVAEIYAGMRPAESVSTMTLLDALVIIPVTRHIAERAGHFKARTRARRVELADCLIAATAFMEGAALATGNVKDYPMPEITVLTARP